jgi:transcriptional regulator GlxA family with amidase domain
LNGQITNPRTIGIMVFQGMVAADFLGPTETFSRATTTTGNDRTSRCYSVITVGISTEPCTMECGVVIKPHVVLDEAPHFDTLIVPGGPGIHNPRLSKKIAKWVSRRAPVTRRIVSIADGIYPLGATGLLDGRHVTTHWRLARDVALRFPDLQVTSNRLFVRDGRFYTCAGGAAAVDLSLSLIEEDCGRQIALEIAQELIIHVKRSGEQEQRSEALQFQVQSSDRFTDITAWILCHLSSNLSIETLSQRACMSPRNFARLFKAAFGQTPAEFVTRARIAEARRRLEVPRNNIESVAASLGFRSADAFSRAFEREIGCRPSTYRDRFGAPRADVVKEFPKAVRMVHALARA